MNEKNDKYEIDGQSLERYGTINGYDDGTVLVPARVVVGRQTGIDSLTEALNHAAKPILLDEDQRAMVRTALQEAPNAHDRAILTAVDALDSGRQVIELDAVARKMQAKYFAIAPASMSGKMVTRTWDRSNGDIIFSTKHWSMKLPALSSSEAYRFTDRKRRLQGMVPYIPPMCRVEPLKDKLILWEHGWREDKAERIRMHLDPALIEHVIGDLYVVLTTWDLTPLERAALGG